MSDIITLTFPAGVFTHSELAAHNGRTNQQVWQAYQKAIADKTIIFVGERKGKGKPSKLWKVNDGTPIPDIQPVVQAPKQSANRVQRTPVQPVTVMDATVEEVETKIEPVIEKKKEVVKLETVEPLKVEEIRPVQSSVVTVEVVPTDFGCPVCGTKMLSQVSPTGVTVWCPVNDLKICKSSENPYGHSNNIKNAFEIACEKFRHI